MSQDTRKDKRAKVVSLNVRYKSATVDEFIENHSHDVSKGGLFVKTPTPFPPGTLLKFEIRLAGDKSVISGVGRVVWKREPTQAGAEKPAGMGVKFIKIDESSRAIIDRLIAQKADAGSAYTSEQPVDELAGHPSTLRGLVAASPSDESLPPPGPQPVTAPAPSGGGMKLPVPSPPSPAAKNLAVGGTLAGPRPSGLPNVPPSNPVLAPPTSSAKAAAPPPKPSSKPSLGAPKPPPRPAASSTPAPAPSRPATAPGGGPSPAAAASPSIPGAKTPSEPKLAGPPRPPPAERKATMMGMGIATTPPPPNTAAPSPTPPPAAARERGGEPMFPKHDPDSGSEPVRDQTVMKQAAELLEEALKEAGGSLDEIGHNPLFSQDQIDAAKASHTPPPVAPQPGDTMIMGSPPPSISPSAPLSGPPAGAPDTSSVRAGSSPSQPLILDAPPSFDRDRAPISARPLSEDLGARRKSGGGGMGPLAGIIVVLLLAGGGVFAWQTGMFSGGGGTEAQPSASPTPSAPPSSPPSAMGSAPVAPATAMDASAAKDAAVTATADAAAAAGEADAGKAPTTTTTAVAPPKPPPAQPRPGPRPAPPKPPPAETPPTTAEPPPAPTPAPAPTPTTAPTPPMEPWAPPP